MSDNGKLDGFERYWLCGKPAKFWIKDSLNRSGWNGKQMLCGVHANAFNKKAKRAGTPEVNIL